MTDVDVWGEDRPVGRLGLLLDIAGACALGLLGAVAGTSQSRWSVVAAVVLALALAVRRVSWPVAVGLGVVGGVVQLVSGDVNIAADLAYAPIAFTLGAHRAARVRWLGLGCVVVGVVGAGVWATLQVSRTDGAMPRAAVDAVAMAGLAALVLGGGWLTGYVRWQRREAVRARVAATVQSVEERRLQELVAQEQQRARIAADMHDVVAHSWAVVAAQADGARYTLRSDPDRAEEALVTIGETARTAMTDVRLLLTRLRQPGEPGGPNESGGAPPDDLGVEEPHALVERMRRSGMSLDVRRSGPAVPDPALAVTAHRVLAEALTNALKHGDLSQPVRVEEDWGEGYRLRVTNALVPDAPAGAGHGLVGMAERVEGSGGTMTAGPSVGPSGRMQWVVSIEIPFLTREDQP